METEQINQPEQASTALFHSPELNTLDVNKRLALLVEFGNNPWFTQFKAALYKAQKECLTEVLDKYLEGVHDIMNREQILGEIRGLKRFISEFEEELKNHQAEIKSQFEKQNQTK